MYKSASGRIKTGVEKEKSGAVEVVTRVPRIFGVHFLMHDIGCGRFGPQYAIFYWMKNPKLTIHGCYSMGRFFA